MQRPCFAGIVPEKFPLPHGAQTVGGAACGGGVSAGADVTGVSGTTGVVGVADGTSSGAPSGIGFGSSNVGVGVGSSTAVANCEHTSSPMHSITTILTLIFVRNGQDLVYFSES